MVELGFQLVAVPFAVLALALAVLAIVPALSRGDAAVRLGFIVIGACALPWALTTALNASVVDGAPSVALARAGFMPLAAVGSGLLLVLLGVAGRIDEHRRVLIGSFVVNGGLMAMCGATDWVVADLAPTPWGLPYPRAGVLYGLFVAAIPVCVGYGLWAGRGDPVARLVGAGSRRAVGAVGVLAVLAVSDVFLTYGWFGVYPFSWVPSLAAAGLSLYAMSRGDVLRRRGLDRGALLEAAILAAAYLALVALVATTDRPLILALAGGAIAAATIALGRTVELAEAPGPRTDQARALDRLHAELDLAEDERQITAAALGFLSATAVLDHPRVVSATTDTPPPVVRDFLVRMARPFALADLASERLGRERGAILAWLADQGCDVVVPLCERDQLVGLVVGDVAEGRTLRDGARALLEPFGPAVARAYSVVELHQAIDAQAALTREVELADAVRQARASSGRLAIGGVEIAISYQPATRVAGDLWFTGALPDGRPVVLVGDVAGRGTSAALVSAAVVGACAAAVGLAGPSATATELLTRLHHVVRGIDGGRHRVTAALAVVEPDGAGRRVVFAVSGHRGGYLVRAGDGATELVALVGRGAPLGDPDWRAAETSYPLLPSDLVVVPSDGVAGARDASGAAWGERRLQRALRELASSGRGELGAAALAAVRAHVGAATLDDDLLIVTVTP